MPQVLMITYKFPPIVNPGAIRSGKFVKYLPEYGWEPVVLTTAVSQADTTDQNLLNELNEGLQICRIPSRKPNFRGIHTISKFLPIAGLETLWLKDAVTAGMQLILKQNCKIIWSTALPPVCHLVGVELKRRTGLPLILDYRDLWTLNPYRSGLMSLQRRIDYQLEKRILNFADGVMVISESMKVNMQTMLCKSHNYRVIPNGFDPSDLMLKSTSSNGSMTCAHIGSIYGQRVPTAYNLLKGLLLYEQIQPEQAAKLRIRFIGSVDKAFADAAKAQLKLIQPEFTGSVPHAEAIKAMHDASILLLINEMTESGSVTSKIFEYLATDRPILILGHSYEISKMVKELVDCQHVIETTDSQAIVKALHNLLKLCENNQVDYTLQRNLMLNTYSRKELTKKFASFLDETCM